ncbi:MAG: protein kinase domain-containing protein [bacterium]
MLGSPKYISPEVLTDKSPAKPSMDIWSMGIILYRILHGYFPFQAETCKELFELIKKGEYSISPKIKSTVSKCCLDFIDSML